MGSLIHVTAWERVSLWRRILCAFVRVSILIALLDVLIMLLGPPISISLTVRQEARAFPGVMVTPQPPSDYSVSVAPGTEVRYFGYPFEVPWDASFKRKTSEKGSLGLLWFESGQSVI